MINMFVNINRIWITSPHKVNFAITDVYFRPGHDSGKLIFVFAFFMYLQCLSISNVQQKYKCPS